MRRGNWSLRLLTHFVFLRVLPHQSKPIATVPPNLPQRERISEFNRCNFFFFFSKKKFFWTYVMLYQINDTYRILVSIHKPSLKELRVARTWPSVDLIQLVGGVLFFCLGGIFVFFCLFYFLIVCLFCVDISRHKLFNVFLGNPAKIFTLQYCISQLMFLWVFVKHMLLA